MGDRANVFIQTDYQATEDAWVGIGVYSHWHGTILHDVALQELPKAMQRLGDSSYFARILIHNILTRVADPASPTGTGIWVLGPDDNEYPILVVNAMTGHHWYCADSEYRNSQPVEA